MGTEQTTPPASDLTIVEHYLDFVQRALNDHRAVAREKLTGQGYSNSPALCCAVFELFKAETALDMLTWFLRVAPSPSRQQVQRPEPANGAPGEPVQEQGEQGPFWLTRRPPEVN